MGMFSWACKGCGHDLKRSELVRMNGCKGLYDGYGGNSGGFDSENAIGEPVCWHERCYQRANTAQRDDDTPSENASNQGFGYPALAFLKGYDDQATTTYKVIVHARENEQDFEYYAVKDENKFVLCDRIAYQKAWDNWDGMDDLPEDFDDMTEEWHAAFLQKNREQFKNQTGLTNPETNCATFNSLEEAKKVANDLVSTMPTYNIVILGQQGKIEGLCYERSRYRKYRRTNEGIVPTGDFREEIDYEHNIPNKNRKNRLAQAMADLA